jgi:hypothetical protein
MGRLSSSFSWLRWPRGKSRTAADDAALSPKPFEVGDRRQLLQALSVMATGGALAAMSQPAEAKDASELPPLSGR